MDKEEEIVEIFNPKIIDWIELLRELQLPESELSLVVDSLNEIINAYREDVNRDAKSKMEKAINKFLRAD